MIEFLYRYSGLFAMVTAWMLVVYPAMKFGVNSKQATISTATVNGTFRLFISIGLLAGSLFQLLFLKYLITRYQLGFYSISSILYTSSIISTILVVFFTKQKHHLLHTFFVTYYFIIFPLSLFLFETKLLTSLILLLLYYLGIVLTILKWGINAHTEQWAFLVLSLWTIMLTYR